MFKFLKKLFCKHDYKLLCTYKTDTDETLGYKMQEIYVIYCPKCKSRLRLLKHEYEMIINQQKVDKEYQNDNKQNRNN